MDDALLLRRFERLGNLFRDGQRLVERDRTTRNALREILALDEFHHQGVRAQRLLEAVDRGDVGMIQRRERLRLAFEPRETIGVSGKCVRQNLDRHLSTQRRVGRPIHLAHPTFADRRGDVVDADARAECEGQR